MSLNQQVIFCQRCRIGELAESEITGSGSWNFGSYRRKISLKSTVKEK
jgi:hypothetical protein